MNKRITPCEECSRQFWYLDPRPGGRPRKKCGICSSRPPRYPWGYIDPSRPHVSPEVYIPDLPMGEVLVTYQTPKKSKKNQQDQAHALEAYPLPVEKTQHQKTSQASATTVETRVGGGSVEVLNTSTRQTNPKTRPRQELSSLERRLDELTERLERLETKVNQLDEQSARRKDWVDLSARLDIVEQDTSTTLNKVRGRLETFSKDVQQIAVVPEQELQSMFELVNMLRHYLELDQKRY